MGTLILLGTDIEIPDDLHVDGDLDLRKTKITELPEGLRVIGSLDVEGLNIAELPDNLYVGDIIIIEEPLLGSEKCQLQQITKHKDAIEWFKNPTEKAKKYHMLRWEL